jgi:aminopeptidase N
LSLLLAAFLISFASLAASQPRFHFDSVPGRLSKDVVPSRYALALDLEPAAEAFHGNVEISVQVRRPVASIELHAHQLQVVSADLVSGDRVRRSLRIEIDHSAQTWRLVRADAGLVAPGEHRLDISYRGVVQKTGYGLFSAPYKFHGREEKMLATQLASIHARSLLPAFDEPAFRAVFDVSVRVPAGLEVLSNMPRIERRMDGSSELHRFAPTPAMPSYLLAVSVGRFDMLEGEAAGVPLRVFTAPGKREQARYALEVTRQVLPFYVEYFGIPYALPKLDQIAVPGTRTAAMEDWGLISYDEPSVLFDPERSSAYRRHAVFDTVAHEISHQWFGNLVTHAWWDDIWLNEAFATWIAAKATDRFNPEWQIPLRRRLETDGVMARDSGASTRAIRSGPVSESAVYDVLDSITYTKGGAVLSMLEQWIGEEPFRHGLGAFMRERKLSNATAGDLWHHIAEASGKVVAPVAASWTDQPGLPLIDVQTACKANRTKVQFRQSRFVTSPRVGTDVAWSVPLVMLHGDKTATFLLDRKRDELDLPGCSTLVVNAGGRGYYRVNYAPAQRTELTRRFETLSPADKVTLLSDRFALVQAGRVPARDYFALLDALAKVDDASRPTLFRMASDALAFFDDAFAGTSAQEPVRRVARDLLGAELARIGWEAAPNEDPQWARLRSALVAQLAQFGDRPTIERASRMFDADANGTSPLRGGMRTAVIRAAATNADRGRFDLLLARLRSAESEEDRQLYASALAAGRDRAQAQLLLEASLDGSIPANIASGLPALVTTESPHGDLAYEFTVRNWDRLANLAGKYFSADAWLLPNAAWRFNAPEKARRLLDDQRRVLGTEGPVPAGRAAAQIELLAAVRERDARHVAATVGKSRPAAQRK